MSYRVRCSHMACLHYHCSIAAGSKASSCQSSCGSVHFRPSLKSHTYACNAMPGQGRSGPGRSYSILERLAPEIPADMSLCTDRLPCPTRLRILWIAETVVPRHRRPRLANMICCREGSMFEDGAACSRAILRRVLHGCSLAEYQHKCSPCGFLSHGAGALPIKFGMNRKIFSSRSGCAILSLTSATPFATALPFGCGFSLAIAVSCDAESSQYSR